MADRVAPAGSERFRPDPEGLLARVVAWAESDAGVTGLLLLGSRARADRPADAWSDTDLILVLDDPARVLDDPQWPARFGRVAITFTESTMGGRRERRTLFDDGTDLDVVPLSIDQMREGLEDPHALGVLARGHRVLVDSGGLFADLASRLEGSAVEEPAPMTGPPSAADFLNLVSDFWYHAVWSARKLRRGELWTARLAIDERMKWQLLTVIEWRARVQRPGADPWFSGRFLERWADRDVLAALARCFAHYDERDLARALVATMDLFRELARELAAALSLPYPDAAEEAATALVDELLVPPVGSPSSAAGPTR